MSSRQQADRTDTLTTIQREKERERRRLRDRQRRQNMTQEQRERHLARRRRNYQLRRLRAQNAKALDSPPPNTSITPHSSPFPSPTLLPITSKLQGAQSFRKSPRRLRLSDIRHLARRLHNDGHNKIGDASLTTNHCPNITYMPMKRLRLIHVKRLARTIKATLS